MKILYLHQYFKYLNQSGGTRSYEFARRLVKWGHEVHIVSATSDNLAPEVVEGINVHWVPVAYSNKMGFYQRIFSFFSFAVKSSLIASRIKADVVFATSTPLTIIIPGYISSRLQGIPLVFEIRDIWPAVPIALGALKNPFVIKLAKLMEKFAYKKSVRIVALAPGMAKHVEDTGYDRRGIAIIPNGCDFELFGGKGSSKTTTTIVLYMGTIGQANGVDYIPKLAAAVKKIYPDLKVEFYIAGDGKLKEQVELLAAELGVLETYVKFLGSIPKSEVPDWTKMASATIMTYDGPEILYRDSVSNKFFDSLAAGKPVFSNFRGFSTIIAENFGAGIILDSKNIDLAAKTFAETVSNEHVLKQMSIESLKLAKMFDRENLAKSLEILLAEVVNNTPIERVTMIGKQFREIDPTLKI